MTQPLLGYYPPDDFGIFFETFIETLEYVDSNNLLLHQVLNPVMLLVEEAQRSGNHFVGRRRFSKWISYVRSTIGIDITGATYDDAIEWISTTRPTYDVYSEWFEEIISCEADFFVFASDLSSVFDAAIDLGLSFESSFTLREAARRSPNEFIIACDGGWHQPFIVFGSPTITTGKLLPQGEGELALVDVTEAGTTSAYGIPPDVMKDLLETHLASEGE